MYKGLVYCRMQINTRSTMQQNAQDEKNCFNSPKKKKKLEEIPKHGTKNTKIACQKFKVFPRSLGVDYKQRALYYTIVW